MSGPIDTASPYIHVLMNEYNVQKVYHFNKPNSATPVTPFISLFTTEYKVWFMRWYTIYNFILTHIGSVQVFEFASLSDKALCTPTKQKNIL
jgi:hypothetical protein